MQNGAMRHLLIAASLLILRKSAKNLFLGENPRKRYLSYILLGSSVCHPVCHPVIFLSSCHNCGTLSYSLCLSIQTDQGDDTEGFEREGYRWWDRRWRDWRGRVWIDFSLLKAQPKKNVGSQCHLQLLYWTTYAVVYIGGFFAKLEFSRGFLYLLFILPFIYIPLPSVCLIWMSVIQQTV
jgi:hypothetical protein